MKRILLVDYDLSILDGCRTVVVNLANELSGLNKYEIYLLSLDTTKEKIPFSVSEKVHFSRWQSLNKRVLYTYFMKRNQLKLYVEKEKIDIVIFAGMASLYSMAIYPNAKIRIINCDHSGLKNQWNDKKTVICKWIQSKWCDRFIVLNESIRKEYIDYLKADSNKILIIPNWIDNIFYDIAYCPESKKIVTIGRLSEEKGYDLLVQIASIIYEKYPDWHWDVYGDGPYRPIMEKLIKEKHLEQFIILKGAVKNAADKLQGYAMFVLTSYREAFPIVLLEAKAKKLPVISFDINSGPNFVIQDGVDGFLIRPYEIKDMANKISYLIECPEMRILMSNNSQKNLDTYSKRNILLQWQKLLDTN